MKDCGVCCIELTGKFGKGKVAIVDDDTYQKYGHLKWHLSNWGYAMRRIGNRGEKKQTILLHRLVMGAKDGEIVDHLNRNRLDNRRANLRICTASDNCRNRSGVKGVFFDKSRNKWTVQYRGKFCGRYDSKVEAERQYQLMKSGVKYVPKTTKYRRPKYIYFMGRYKKPYQVNPYIDGKRVFLGNYATIDEAKTVLDKFIEESKEGKSIGRNSYDGDYPHPQESRGRHHGRRD